MNRRTLALILSAALCLTFTGCSNHRSSSEAESAIILPEPPEQAPNMILGEQITAEAEVVTLYYVSGDGTSFSTINKRLAVSSISNLCEETVDALLYSISSPDRMAFLPPEMKVLEVNFSGGIVTIRLSIDAYGMQSEQEYLTLLSTLSNTLLSIEGVQGVNLLIGDRCESVASLPVGVLTRISEGITPTYAQYSAEHNYFLESETGTISRTAALYFPTEIGEWFVPELREITFDSRDYASALIRALRSGPSELANAISAIPEGADLLVDNPSVTVNASGERIVELNFSGALRNYLAFSGIDEWELAGSVALTLCSFIPEMDAVRICIDNIPITGCMIGETELDFPDGLIHRRDFASYIGSTVRLYVPQSNGTLEIIERAISATRALSPLNLLYELFDNILSSDDGAFPQDVYYDDILGVTTKDGIASVNLSANFYRQCQDLDENSELSVIYSIVNTLCELSEITGVRFFIEGLSAETLAGNIYLKSILLPNPGAVNNDPFAIATP